MKKNRFRFFMKVFSIPIIVAALLFALSPHFKSSYLNQNEVLAEVKKADNSSSYMSCNTLRERVRDFLKYHYLYRIFDEKISARTFDTYFKLLDPGRLYFYKSDIANFGKYKNILGQKVYASECDFIKEIYDTYTLRVGNATRIADTLLSKPFDFTKEEFIETDRKKLEWATNDEELTERWRKTLKFIVLNMKEPEGTKKVVERLTKRYSNILKDISKRSNDEINSMFLNSFALSLDPHSSFLTPVDNDQFQIDFSLKLVGIGATLTSPDGYTTIDAVVPGGAASKDGRLKKGDKIVAVDSGDGSGFQDVIDMALDKVVQLIRGKEGTIVKLMILRKEATQDQPSRLVIDLKRAVVQIKDSEARSDVLTIGNKKLGVINLPSFYIDYRGCQEDSLTCRSSANDMLREINKLKSQNVDGILVDLRRNGGGDLNEAQRIVSFFIQNPVVTQVQDKFGQVRALEVQAPSVYKGPVAVLISRYSASASEIFAGAVQDYGRGLLIGDSRTFGKGSVQTVIELPGTSGRQTNGAIHVTIAKFFRPSGKSNQETGVKSDVVIPDPVDLGKIGESEYEHALPNSTIEPSPNFRARNDLSQYTLELQKRSTARLEQSKEFKPVLEAFKKAKENQNTLVSLKEAIVKKDPSKVTQVKEGLDSNDAPPPPVAEDSAGLPSNQVIHKNDVELKEALNILSDAVTLVNKKDWESKLND